MQFLKKFTLISISLMAAAGAAAQKTPNDADDAEQLKIAALEALVAAPEDRALPIVEKVLKGDYSDGLKSRALFVLSQIDRPEAQKMLVDMAKTGKGSLRLDAIRMIGISGDADGLAGLKEIYAGGDASVRESVLAAYLIADDAAAVYEIAVNAADDKELEAAINILGAMDARDELRKLRERIGNSESLIHAYAISGDYESLRELALDNSDPNRQAQAIHGLGIVGGNEANATLLQVYKSASTPQVREAALQGMQISDYDEGVLELFRASQNPDEKRQLLRALVIMDSDAVVDIIDATLDGTP
jgi:HEAT repeat protein